MSDKPTFLGMEPLLVARLEEALAPLAARVLCVADMAGVLEKDLPKPSARIVYGGHQVVRDDKPQAPGWALIEQTWLVVPAVRNVRDIKTGTAGRAEASPLIDAVWDALDGWRPGSGYSPLKSVTPGLRPATVEGCTYVPLAFTTRFRRNQSCPT